MNDDGIIHRSPKVNQSSSGIRVKKNPPKEREQYSDDLNKAKANGIKPHQNSLLTKVANFGEKYIPRALNFVGKVINGTGDSVIDHVQHFPKFLKFGADVGGNILRAGFNKIKSDPRGLVGTAALAGLGYGAKALYNKFSKSRNLISQTQTQTQPKTIPRSEHPIADEMRALL
jgi:hypothetical protein